MCSPLNFNKTSFIPALQTRLILIPVPPPECIARRSCADGTGCFRFLRTVRREAEEMQDAAALWSLSQVSPFGWFRSSVWVRHASGPAVNSRPCSETVPHLKEPDGLRRTPFWPRRGEASLLTYLRQRFGAALRNEFADRGATPFARAISVVTEHREGKNANVADGDASRCHADRKWRYPC